MNLNEGDQPLGDQFLQNPYEYFQSFVRNMNNEVFLSQYQLNHLYALLLLRKQSPWDSLKPNSANLKAEVQQMVNQKVADVKKVLQSLSQMYEDKLKKNTFTQLERLMSILKARNKSIFIEKDMHHLHSQMHNLTGTEGRLLKHLIQQKLTQNQDSPLLQMQKQKLQSLKENNNKESQSSKNDFSCQTMEQQQNQDNNKRAQDNNQVQKEQKNQMIDQNRRQLGSVEQQNVHRGRMAESKSQEGSGDQRQVLSLFYGIANIPNLSSLALGNCLQYSAAQRYIKFKMSKNYIMTIKNEDEMSFDRTSVLKNVSTDLFVHRIFPYLTAVQLFKARGVCKEWMQNVKQAWHSTFKREMFVQLMACEFCKQIEFYYKLIQLRNPFFQKVSLLMHALLQIIQWDKVYESVNNNTIIPQLKKVLIILLKLLGQEIVTPNLNSITEQIWQQHKQKTLTLKQRISQFLNNIESSGLNIMQLIKIKLQLLDDPFMRVQQLNSEDKTPLLLVIFIKQLTLQQILKNHIYFSQQYLMKTKSRLDNISSKMPQQKGFLQGVYKIILLRSFGGSKNENKEDQQEQRSQMPNFSTILTSIFQSNEEMDKPDFVLKSKSSSTNIYMDKATKLDIIVSTVKKMNTFQLIAMNAQNRDQNQSSQNQRQIPSSLNERHQERQKEESMEDELPKKSFKTVNTYSMYVKPEQKGMSLQENQESSKQNPYNPRQKNEQNRDFNQ